MKTKQFLTLLVLMIVFFNSYGQKAMTFQEAEVRGRSFQHLDSLYKSAVDADPKRAVFKTPQEQAELQKSYSALIQDLGVFLKANDFNWEKPTRCFNRIYFNPGGKIDYFLFNFPKDMIAAEKEKEFQRLLNVFIKDYKFPMKAKENFAQCSPVKYN
ncbi:hypothetical protein [Pedobacter gandavensis]|uniref:Uncharacterized protein n=1 Tax=Pedobacter gandavensis TaxID=2679963 RepID=A0ABR6ESX9_9SPHI|nr:hypothetical protein [Pedobacter gandavensis]MBB2147929.1 hypothetical protein [Pedobacter gandavensis]